MTHEDTIRKLSGHVLDALGTIRIVEKGLMNEDTDTVAQVVGALSLTANVLQTVHDGLERLASDLLKGGGA